MKKESLMHAVDYVGFKTIRWCDKASYAPDMGEQNKPMCAVCAREILNRTFRARDWKKYYSYRKLFNL